MWFIFERLHVVRDVEYPKPLSKDDAVPCLECKREVTGVTCARCSCD